MIVSRRIHYLCVFLAILIFHLESKTQIDAVAIEWGEMKQNPELGFNARIRSQHQLSFCEQPLPQDSKYDWNNQSLRDRIADLSPDLLRFPGGTPSNFWIWEDEVREVVNLSGGIDLVTFCEGSSIPRNLSLGIGCTGQLAEVRAETLEDAYISSTVTLASYRDAMNSFRADGIATNELFVISLIDPLYYVGSPSLEYATSSLSVAEKKGFMKDNVVQRAQVILDKILLEYCDGCNSLNLPFSFELGNELHLSLYGKYLPKDDCFSGLDICEDCLTDVDMYADICEEVIPMIRSRFPNAEVAVNGSRNVGGDPWNQVIIDRLSSGAIQADAAMVHFYPRSSNPDSLSLGLCTGLESAIDVDKILHYQQVYTDYLFDKRNLNLFDDTNIDLWFTEFSPYDFSESCSAQFGVDFELTDHNYDSGNWLHALNIFNIFNSFSHYRSSDEDLWMSGNHGLNINKMCMHRLFESPREAAIDDDLDLTAAGIAINALLESIDASTSMGLLMLASPDRIAIDNNGNWEAVDDSVAPCFFYELEYTAKNGTRLTEDTWDLFGWKFSSNAEKSAIIVNVSGSGYDLDFANLDGFINNTYFKTYKVPKNKLTWTLNDGEESAGLNIQEGIIAAGSLVLPPFSFTILKGNFEFNPPLNNGCSSAQEIVPAVWGIDDWTEWRYSGSQGNRPSCIDNSQVDDIWFKFIPKARDEVIYARDAAGRLDLVVEVYNSCSESSIACFDNYPLGETETAFVNDLSIGQEYYFRVYAKSSNILDIDFLQVQVKSLTTAGLRTVYCENLGLDDADEILAIGSAEIYNVDPGISAYRFRFIPESGGDPVIYKNEAEDPFALPLVLVNELQDGENYDVKVQHRITIEANGELVNLWSELDEGCRIGISNNCTAFESAPLGLSKSLEPVNGIIDRIQLKWYKGPPEVPFSIPDSAACDFEFWPVKDLVTNEPILNGNLKFINQKSKPGQPFFKWPMKFTRESIVPNRSYKWRVRCACEYGNGIMSPWSEEKFFNTPDYDPLTNIFTPGGLAGGTGQGGWLKAIDDDSKSGVSKFMTSLLIDENVQIEVYDLLGKPISEIGISIDSERSFTLTWSSKIKKGFYLIKMSNRDTIITTRHFIGF